MVGDDILAAYLAADASSATAETVTDNDRNLQPTIQAVETETENLKNTVQDTLDLEQKLTTERKSLALHLPCRCILRFKLHNISAAVNYHYIAEPFKFLRIIFYLTFFASIILCVRFLL